VTVRIEEESFATDDAHLALGMWRDRDDLADVAAYIRRLRAPRFERKSGRAMLVDTDVVTEFMAATD